jgi:hypothetical protein
MFFDYFGGLLLSKTTLIIVSAAAAVALGAAGCGGGGGDASGAGAPSSDEQAFIKQADAICAKGEKQVAAEFTAFLKTKSIKENGGGQSRNEASANELEVAEKIGIPALRRQIDELETLEAPPAKRSKVEAYFEAANGETKSVEKEPLSLFGVPGVVFKESDRVAKEIGFKVCGNH